MSDCKKQKPKKLSKGQLMMLSPEDLEKYASTYNETYVWPVVNMVAVVFVLLFVGMIFVMDLQFRKRWGEPALFGSSGSKPKYSQAERDFHTIVNMNKKQLNDYRRKTGNRTW